VLAANSIAPIVSLATQLHAPMLTMRQPEATLNEKSEAARNYGQLLKGAQSGALSTTEALGEAAKVLAVAKNVAENHDQYDELNHYGTSERTIVHRCVEILGRLQAFIGPVSGLSEGDQKALISHLTAFLSPDIVATYLKPVPIAVAGELKETEHRQLKIGDRYFVDPNGQLREGMMSVLSQFYPDGVFPEGTIRDFMGAYTQAYKIEGDCFELPAPQVVAPFALRADPSAIFMPMTLKDIRQRHRLGNPTLNSAWSLLTMVSGLGVGSWCRRVQCIELYQYYS